MFIVKLGCDLPLHTFACGILGAPLAKKWRIVDVGRTFWRPGVRNLLFMSFLLGRSSWYLSFLLLFLGLFSFICFSRLLLMVAFISWCHLLIKCLVIINMHIRCINTGVADVCVTIRGWPYGGTTVIVIILNTLSGYIVVMDIVCMSGRIDICSIVFLGGSTSWNKIWVYFMSFAFA